MAVAANRFSKLTRVPDIIVLLMIGITLGPITHWVNPAHFEGVIRIVGTLALILDSLRRWLGAAPPSSHALFSCRLDAGHPQLRTQPGAGRSRRALDYHPEWTDCLLLGAALGCTSGAIVIPALQQISTPEGVKIALTIESSLGEVVAVLLVGSLLKTNEQGSLIGGLATDFSRHIAVSLLVGFIIAAVWSRLWPKIAGTPNSNILNLGVVLGVYSVGDYLHGSGLLTVLIFGVTLANLPRTPHMTRQGARILAFHAEFSFLVRSFFFVLLGIVAQFISRQYIIPILGILVALVLARYAAMMGSRWIVKDVTKEQTELLFWMLPRGLVTAVLALGIVEARGETFSFLPAMAFTVVLVTNLFIVWGSVRAGKTATALATTEAIAVAAVGAPEMPPAVVLPEAPAKAAGAAAGE